MFDHLFITTKIYRFETNKICNVIFWIENDFLFKKTSIFGETVVPLHNTQMTFKCSLKLLCQ